jgi:flagellar motor switch protein FliG
MEIEKNIVITAFGHDRTIDKIAVSSFDKAVDHYGRYSGDANADAYCATINNLELSGNSWIFAKIVAENVQYPVDLFSPLQFDIILRLDDRAIQRVLREIDAQDIARALKGEKEDVKEKIFRNMSKRAAQMLQEDMEYMGGIRISAVKESQKKFVDIVRHLEQTGEVVIAYEGDTVK